MRFLPLHYLVSVAICAAMINGAAVAVAKSSTTHPNIVVVLIDDMGWGDFSCFGNKSAKTPNIDQLASEGLRFEQFYVNSPICSPSRVAISTGQYPTRWRITSFLNNRKSNEQRGMAQWLDPKAPMLARILHRAGYTTGHFGKWHLGGQRDVGDAPMISEYGFDQSLTNFEGLGPRLLPLLDAYDGKPAHSHALGSDSLGKGPIEWENRDKITASFTKAAIKFIDEAQAQNKPFFINLWPDDVHSPFFPPKESRGDRSKRELYLAVLKHMDEQLGQLFQRIQTDPALRDNTLIVVCSDNGPEEGAGTAGPFRGKKGLLYEGGVRSPLIIWAPDMMNAKKIGAVNTESYLAAIDLVPSLLEVAKVSVPGTVNFDGQPLADVLLGESERSRHKPLFFRRPPDRPNDDAEGNLPDLAVRDGRWKLLCEYDGSSPQLYNLKADRGETKNIAAKHPKVVSRLTKALLAWHAAMPADEGAAYAVSQKPGLKHRNPN